MVNPYFLCEGEYILRVIFKDEAIILWEKLNNEFKFKPGTDITGEWIIIPGDTKKYHKATPWSEEQEKIINSILKELGLEKMYALDWNHDCFEFSPMEDISMNYNYYDPDRQCQVYFPTYYPDGDYYFFIDSTWNCGIFGHPWRNEIIVMGKELIKMFEKNKGRLGL